MQYLLKQHKHESWVAVGKPHLDAGHYCWKPSTATGSGQKKSLMAVCHCELCAGPLTEDQQCWTSLCNILCNLLPWSLEVQCPMSLGWCHWIFLIYRLWWLDVVTAFLIGGTGLWRAGAGCDSRQISFVSQNLTWSVISQAIKNRYKYKKHLPSWR